MLLLAGGCTSMDRIERYRPIMGYWKTNRNVIVSIHNSPDLGVGAYVMEAPGHLGPEAKPDAPVIVDIQPRSQTMYEGKFVMPGKEKPIRVQIVLSGRNTLNILSWDKRVEKRIMQWHRVNRH